MGADGGRESRNSFVCGLGGGGERVNVLGLRRGVEGGKETVSVFGRSCLAILAGDLSAQFETDALRMVCREGSGRPRLQVVSRRESVGLDLGEGAQRPHEAGCEASEGLDDEKDNEVAAGEGFVVVRELLRAGGAHVCG